MSSQCMTAESQESPFKGFSLSSVLCFLGMCENALKCEGFLAPPDGGQYVKVARDFITEAMIHLKDSALRVVLYLFAHSWGFQEYGRKLHLTIDEFVHGRKKADGTRMDQGAGLSESSARTGLRLAEKAGYITCETDDHDRGRIAKSYGIHVRYMPEEDRGVKSTPPAEQQAAGTSMKNSTLARGVNFTPLGDEIYTSGPQNLHLNPVKFTPRTGKGTLERNSLKETLERKDTVATLNEKELTQLALSFPPLSSRISVETFRTMPWTAETILAGLSHCGIAVPDGEAIKASGNAALLDWWQKHCLLPATWMLQEMEKQHEYPIQAWRRHIERHARGMTEKGAPTWFASKRVQSSPVFPWHMVGGNKATGELTGKQWRAVRVELDKGNWWQSTSMDYEGPGYEGGYSGSTTVVEVPTTTEVMEVRAGEAVSARITQELTPVVETEEVEPETDDIPAELPDSQADQEERDEPMLPELRGMTSDTAQRLLDEIIAEHPNVQGEFALLDDGSYVLNIFDSDLSHFAIWRPQDWRRPVPCNARRIADAIAYGNWVNGEPGEPLRDQTTSYQYGMSPEQATELQSKIWQQYPTLLMRTHVTENGGTVLKVQCTRSQEVTIFSASEWFHLGTSLKKSITQAVLYSKVEAKRRSMCEEGA